MTITMTTMMRTTTTSEREGEQEGESEATQASWGLVQTIALLTEQITYASAYDPASLGRLYDTRACCYQSLGEPEAALADLSRAIYHAPWEASYWYLRAQIAFNLGFFKTCIDDCEQAINLLALRRQEQGQEESHTQSPSYAKQLQRRAQDIYLFASCSSL